MNESVNDRMKRLSAPRKAQEPPLIECEAEVTEQPKGEKSKLDTYRPIEAPKLAIRSEGDALGTISLKVQGWRANMRTEKVRQEAELAMLKDEAEAKKRESFAYWTTISGKIAETMQTYLNEHLRMMEATRMADTQSALEKATDITDAKLKEINAKDLSEFLKDDLMGRVVKQFELACDRIEQNVMMEKYKPKT